MIEISAAQFFSIFYFIFSLGFVLQSKEFIGAGITPENFLGKWLQNTNAEDVQFIQHHVVKSTGTLIIHCCLPLVYLVLYCYFVLIVDEDFPSIEALIKVYPPFYYSLILASTLVVSVFSLAYYWSLDNWQNHPFVKKIKKFSSDQETIATDVNNEFRNIDKLQIRTSALTKIVVTDNWIVKVGQYPWKIQIAHKSDVTLELIKSVHLALSPDSDAGGVQYLTIQVKSRRATKPFEIRCKSTEYRELEQRVRGTIANLDNITIYKTSSERFVEIFREHVEQNPKAEVEEVESCIGCMTVPAEIKLIRRCENSENSENPCVSCYCRPMWCLQCLGKWFAMRQDQNRPETWLASKCPCPTCRSRFCILDVSLIQEN